MLTKYLDNRSSPDPRKALVPVKTTMNRQSPPTIKATVPTNLSSFNHISLSIGYSLPFRRLSELVRNGPSTELGIIWRPSLSGSISSLGLNLFANGCDTGPRCCAPSSSSHAIRSRDRERFRAGHHILPLCRSWPIALPRGESRVGTSEWLGSWPIRHATLSSVPRS